MQKKIWTILDSAEKAHSSHSYRPSYERSPSSTYPYTVLSAFFVLTSQRMAPFLCSHLAIRMVRASDCETYSGHRAMRSPKRSNLTYTSTNSQKLSGSKAISCEIPSRSRSSSPNFKNQKPHENRQTTHRVCQYHSGIKTQRSKKNYKHSVEAEPHTASLKCGLHQAQSSCV